MAISKQIFRKVALDRLSSPEQLDEMMEVTTSRAWLALGAMTALLLAALVWGFTGSLPTTVQGIGILIRTSGLGDVATTSSGQVTQVYVDRGDWVQAGEVVARLAQPHLSEEVASSTARLEELRADHAQLVEFGGEGARLETDVIDQSQANIRSEFRMAKERKQWLVERLESRRRLFKEGLITQEGLQGTVIKLQNVEEQVDDLNRQVKRLKLDTLNASKRQDSELRTSEFKIREAERRLKFLEEKLELNSQVVSAHSGRILELRAAVGDMLGTGSPVLSIELAGDDVQPLEALLYIPSSEGKQVKADMQARVAPSVVRPEEHGMVMGTVTAVSEFSSTKRGMMRVLDNDELVKALLEATQGAPIAVRVQLEAAEITPSGYRWTSGNGPDIELTSGTPCTAAITTKRQRPITLVIPVLRSWLGV